MKKFIKEFKEFALKGNVMDLAVGVIIGAAFQNIVNALTEDFINPLICLVTHSVGEDGVAIDGGVWQVKGTNAVFNYGDFLSSIINFLIMALVLFVLIKAINKLMSIGKKEEPKKITTKKCKFCKSEIDIEATKCPHCTSELTD